MSNLGVRSGSGRIAGMTSDTDIQARLRALPKTDELLARPELAGLAPGIPRTLVVEAVRDAVDSVRGRILGGASIEPSADDIVRDAVARAALAARPSLRPVINATGIIVHTNLGRSLLSQAAADAARDVATSYSTLEYDVESGERGSRHVHVESLLTRLTGAEAAMAVNNNAAAVMLGIAALSRGKDAVVSRGQLVEIGGSFRIPDIMRESGATMVEVGTTNKTHLADYENAITERTGLLLKVHSSNFRVVGFTEEVSLAQLVELGARHGVPVFEDQGSGVLLDLRKYGLPYEPTVAESIAAGAQLVSCSGDKLLGGPQAGILVGSYDVIGRLKKHPMARAVRLDKMTLAALEVTLRAYLDTERALREIPTLRMLTETQAEVGARASALAERLGERLGGAAVVSTAEDISRAGGGALPLADIPTVVVAVVPAPGGPSVDVIEAHLRTTSDPAVIARINEGRLLLDPRTLLPGQDEIIVASMAEAVGTTGT
jgi:L-seryl-tRNA(Ser) seleniumtransferase